MDEGMLATLTEMGFSRNAATRGLLKQNMNLEMAAAYLFENSGDPSLELPLEEESSDMPKQADIEQVKGLGFTE